MGKNPAHGRVGFMELTARGTAELTILARGEVKVQLVGQRNATSLLAEQFMLDLGVAAKLRGEKLWREDAMPLCQAHFVAGTCTDNMAKEAFGALDSRYKHRGRRPKRPEGSDN